MQSGMQYPCQSKKRMRYLPHWSSGAGKKAGTVFLTLVLVLQNLLAGVAPAIAYAEEADGETAVVEIVDQTQDDAPSAVVDEAPVVPDAADDASEPVELPAEPAAVDEEGGIDDANAPPADAMDDAPAADDPASEGSTEALAADEPAVQAEELKNPEVPATFSVDYKIVNGEEGASYAKDTAPVAGEQDNRIWLETSFDIEEGAEYDVEVKVFLNGEDITWKADVSSDKSYVDVPADIDLSQVDIKVTVSVTVPEETETEAADEPVVENEDEEPATTDADAGETVDDDVENTDDAVVPEDADATDESDGEAQESADGAENEDTVPDNEDDSDDTAEKNEEEQADGSSAASSDENIDAEAVAAQMEVLNTYMDEVGMNGEQRQLFMMSVGTPLLRAAGTTGTITSIKETGLYDGVASKYYWTLDGNAAYCMTGLLGSPVTGDTFTLYTGNLSCRSLLDYVLYHGYDGTTITSLNGLDAAHSIVATQAAVWYVIADKDGNVLNWTAHDGSPIISNQYWENRISGLSVNYPQTQAAAQALVNAAVAYANNGGGGPEAGYAKIYLNSDRGHDSEGFIYQHMVMTGEKNGTAKLKKTSSNSGTAGNSNYSLAGAVFGVYSDSACTKKVGELTTDANGDSNTLTLPAGTYYVKELTAPSGFKKSTEVKTVTVVAGSTATVSFADEPRLVTIDGEKSVTNPNMLTISGRSLAGAQYGVYKTRADAQNDANRVGTLTTKADGSTNTLELLAGTYYVKEVKAPAGFTLDETIYSKTLKPGDSWTVESKDTVITAPVKVKKVSSDTTFTSGLACYSLAGAKYGIYKSEDDANANRNRVGDWLITDASGNTNTVELPIGTYWIKEVTPSPGYGLDENSHKVTLRDGDGTKTVTSTEPPLNDPSGASVQKRDADTQSANPIGAGTLGGAQFTLRYWDNVNGTTSGTPKATWVYETNTSGAVNFRTGRIVSGSREFTNTQGARVFPIGTYTIEETKAPTGYLRDSTVYGPYVVKAKGDGQTVTTLNTLIGAPKNIDNEIQRGDVKFLKVDDSGNPMANVEFDLSLVDANGTVIETVTIKTDANGVFDSSRSADKAQAWMPHNGTPDNAKGALPYGSYVLTEKRCEANAEVSTMLPPISFSISSDKQVVDLGTLSNVVVKIHTTLTTDAGSHYAPSVETVTLVDTVTYEGLVPGKTYTMSGTIMDKAAPENPLGISAETTFTPEAADGTVKVIFENVDAEALEGKTTVCFERLTVDDDENFTVVHENIDDIDQTVYFAEFGTTLTGDEGNHEVLAAEDVTLTDTIAYTNLEPGKTYTVTGELMDKETEESTGITASTTFTPEAPDGTVDVTFEFKGVEVAGKTVVAFETIQYEGKTWAVHADITDEAQTVNFPDIHTNLVDNQGDQESIATDETVTLTDTVEYENLTPGKEYTLNAELVDKATGDVLATGTTTFTPEEADGTVDVTIEVALADVKGKVTVCFETLEQEGRKVAIHADIDDAGQTVNFPDGGTTLTGKEGEKTVLPEQPLTLIDTVSYKGLIPGKEYTVTGELMDKETEESTGIKAETTFTPEAADGTVEVTFEFNGFDWMGHELVAFETVSRDGRDVIVHADIEDKDQTVEIPEVEIGTTLADSDGNHEVLATETITLVDTVEYKNLKPGHEYKMTGELMDKATGESLGITAETTFTPEKADGTVEVTFVIEDASLVEGKTLVAFEELFFEKISIAIHADIDDVDQTVTIPKIGTTLTDEEGTKDVVSEGPIVLVDTVEYENLTPGKPYTVTGELMDKATGESLGITASVPLVPEEANGTVEVAFEVADASVLAGRTVVAFETVKQDGREVAIHADIEDEAQTVYFPEIRTTATGDNGTKRVLATSNATITDTVTYTNLVPGKTYTMVGELHVKNADGSDGGPLMVGGKPVTSTVDFTPTEANGTVTMTFTFDASALSGKSVVVFESCYEGEKLVASHADITDIGQTVEVYSIPVTGDATSFSAMMLTASAGLMMLALGMRRKRREWCAAE